jgi:hypothetical protein
MGLQIFFFPNLLSKNVICFELAKSLKRGKMNPLENVSIPFEFHAGTIFLIIIFSFVHNFIFSNCSPSRWDREILGPQTNARDPFSQGIFLLNRRRKKASELAKKVNRRRDLG